MSDKKLNAIKEVEFRVNKCREICKQLLEDGLFDTFDKIDQIDNYLFDINDFINDLKDE